MRETELYQPVHDFLQQQGYRLRAEVSNCDLVAMKEGELVVVEMKTRVNMTLLIQATERQSITPWVYVAIPEPARPNSHSRGVERVIRQLRLGLLLVRFSPIGTTVSQILEPDINHSLVDPRRRARVIQEANARSLEYNIAGSTATTLVTAYREHAIYLACCLERKGPCSPSQLRAMGGGDKTLQILLKNHYGWFMRIRRGIYQITALGIRETRSYGELRRLCMARIDTLRET
ncbi:MAG: DUF2161 family putative PD-(D/E)XK-type phosphodiesterase [Pseudohongiellaceae bacterium]